MQRFSKSLLCISLWVGLSAQPTLGHAGLLDWVDQKLDGVLSLNKQTAAWKEWNGYKAVFISSDGRVIDHSTPDQRTVSEGQAYALFLALINNDKKLFNQLLSWTENNLSQGDLRNHLPAWIWGNKDGQWGVIDPNSASDADLWILYSLIEAGRIWKEDRYLDIADHLAQLIIQKETLYVQGLGQSVLPGQIGFVRPNGSVKLNPSYVPPFLMARLADHFKTQKIWAELYLGSQRLLLTSVEKGLYPDWIEFNNGISNLRKTEGDYDAIRVYLWIGMTPSSDPLMPALLDSIKPFLQSAKQLGYVPETWNLAAGTIESHSGPEGFQYAILPALKTLGTETNTVNPMPGASDQEAWKRYGYYNGMLSLFSQGFMENRYAFGHNGRLITAKSGKGKP